MTNQPEALRLADLLERHDRISGNEWYGNKNAATELRRLHEVNQVLVDALTYCRQKMSYMMANGEWYTPEKAIDIADAALAKARGNK